jgi:hypothetical protein
MAGTLSGSTVVTGTIVYAYDLETRIEFPVVTGPGVRLLPGVWGNVVICMEQDGDDAYICGYDPRLEERFAIATEGGRPADPRIWDDFIVWTEYREKGKIRATCSVPLER